MRRAWLVASSATFAAAALASAILGSVPGHVRELLAARAVDDRVWILVAARDLHPGVRLRDDDVYPRLLPRAMLTDGAFLHEVHVVGQLPHERILAGEIVRADRLADPVRGTGLNVTVPRGMRAMGIALDPGCTLAPLLDPGNFVDVLTTTRGPAPTTRTLLDAAFVLAVHADADPPALTLLVTARQSEILADALANGTITVDLRNEQLVFDPARPVPERPVSADDLRPPPGPPRGPVARRPRPAPQHP